MKDLIDRIRIAIICASLLVYTFLFSADLSSKEYSDNRFLLLDARIIAKTENVSLELGSVIKDQNNPLFEEEYWADEPKKWEARFDNLYPNVIYDDEDKLFKIWYKSFIRDISAETIPVKERLNHEYTGSQRQLGLLYAYSEDGINWIKPSLGLIDFRGSSDNNIVQLNFEGGVFKDIYETNPLRRYKMFGKFSRPVHMAVSFSEDGLRWSEPVSWPPYKVAGDAHNNSIWAPTLNKYVGMTRTFAPGHQRIVIRTTSDDFVNWSEPEIVLQGEGNHDQIYSMPIFYYANVYLGLPSIYNADDDTTDTELAWSPDTQKWYRISPGKTIIPRGNGLENYPDSDYDAGCIYASVPVITDDEILLYYGGSNYYHFDWREGSLNLARMRLDGFAGYEVINSTVTGSVKTELFTVTGSEFRINADINDGGYMHVIVLDEAGQSIAGYNSQSITSNSTDALVTWNGKNLLDLKGKKVAFKFVFENAKLFSFSGDLKVVN